MPDLIWLTRGRLVTPTGVAPGAVKIARGRIAAVRPSAPRGARAISVGGAYVAPGFIDLHVWGEPARVAREAVRHGTTAFLTALGPEPLAQLLADAAQRARLQDVGARRTRAGKGGEAACLGLHLEGPFLNPKRAGALPGRWMRRPNVAELSQLVRAARGRIRLITIAPELPGAEAAIHWCRRHRIAVSLGHTLADAEAAARAVAAGATAVTHVFNAMPPLHHRQASLLDVALTDPRLTAMVIFDGIHVSPSAFRLLVRAKGPECTALVTDSVRHQQEIWRLHRRSGAFYRPDGTLAGSALTMIQAMRHAVTRGGASLADAVRMATEVPARLLGLRDRGALRVGARADLAVFDQDFRMRLTLVGGRVVYRR